MTISSNKYQTIWDKFKIVLNIATSTFTSAPKQTTILKLCSSSYICTNILQYSICEM